MERVERELLVMTQPLPCLTPREIRKAIGLGRRLGEHAAEKGDRRRVGLEDYMSFVEAAEVAGVMTDAARELWSDKDAAGVDVRVVAFVAAHRLARARA